MFLQKQTLEMNSYQEVNGDLQITIRNTEKDLKKALQRYKFRSKILPLLEMCDLGCRSGSSGSGKFTWMG